MEKKDYTKLDAFRHGLLVALGVFCGVAAVGMVVALPILVVLMFGFGVHIAPSTLFLVIGLIPAVSIVGLLLLFLSDRYCKIKNEDIFDPDMLPRNVRPL